jgi:hypothetical protein
MTRRNAWSSSVSGSGPAPSDLIRVEPYELADLEEGDPSRRDQTTHEALPDVEHHCDPSALTVTSVQAAGRSTRNVATVSPGSRRTDARAWCA